jgi:carbonic anhydrase
MHLPQDLIDGYRAFHRGQLRREQARYRELADRGQSPEIMVIGCCDSRVSPEVIFDSGPGELFVVRNIANLVPPYAPGASFQGVSSALEYAVQMLRVKHIVVLGHARCGGIKAFAEHSAPLTPSDFVGKWMSLIAPAKAAVEAHAKLDGTHLKQLEQASLATTLDNLMTFPFVRDQVDKGRLTLYAAYFDVSSGELSVRNPITGWFDAVLRSTALAEGVR